MKRHKKNGLEWLTFELLEPFENLTHAVFTKNSNEYTEDFNLGLHTTEDPKTIQKNFDLIKDTFNLHRLNSAKQTHGINPFVVTEKTPVHIQDCDILLTKTKKEALLISHADCQCAIFYDPIHHTLANVHSGWRGSVKNIYKETIQAMHFHFQTNPKDLLVCIGPSLGPQYAEFINYKEELPQDFWPFQIDKNFFDFWAISRYQLEACGVSANHIEIANLCTISNEKDFFSYRRQVKNEGKGPLKAANATIALLT